MFLRPIDSEVVWKRHPRLLSLAKDVKCKFIFPWIPITPNKTSRIYSLELLTQHSYSESETHHQRPTYILNKLFVNSTSKNLAALAWGTSEKFKIFLALLCYKVILYLCCHGSDAVSAHAPGLPGSGACVRPRESGQWEASLWSALPSAGAGLGRQQGGRPPALPSEDLYRVQAYHAKDAVA